MFPSYHVHISCGNGQVFYVDSSGFVYEIILFWSISVHNDIVTNSIGKTVGKKVTILVSLLIIQ